MSIAWNARCAGTAKCVLNRAVRNPRCRQDEIPGDTYSSEELRVHPPSPGRKKLLSHEQAFR